MSNMRLEKAELLKKLPEIKPEKDSLKDEEQTHRMSLGGALLALAQIDHEREYALCRAVAQHLLDAVPEPDDADLGDQHGADHGES